MGQGSSQPQPSSTKHVFTAQTPVRFSTEVVDALQASPETDSTRASDLELHIQKRVRAELTKLDEQKTHQLAELSEKISAAEFQTSPRAGIDTPQTAFPTIETLSAPLTTAHSSSSSSSISPSTVVPLSRTSVQNEIDDLKRRLEKRKIKEGVAGGDKEVEKARGEVVRCLRVNDRRPLDCWDVVERFRNEVGRLEGGWLGGVLD
ncbi:hypothetical protein MMC09_001889 [Bachmanniomyces sp. S44760]|nr:hypothetical protein [Bachmanniomyces sp. S44760]